MLQALREQLRCKEIWVVGANRYRNPDEDLAGRLRGQARRPTMRRSNLPLDADGFVAELQAEMREALDLLDARPAAESPHVRIDRNGARRLDLALAAGSPARTGEPHRAQGRDRRDAGR